MNKKTFNKKRLHYMTDETGITDEQWKTAGSVINFFLKMQEKGLFHSADKYSQTHVNKFDVDMFMFFDIDISITWNGKGSHYACVHKAWIKLLGSKDLGWIRGPHAETIFRAMAVRKNHLPSVAHLCHKS